jgi:hypothetical protein
MTERPCTTPQVWALPPAARPEQWLLFTFPASLHVVSLSPGSGELDTATYLIRNGASLFLLDHYGDSPIHTAAARGHHVLLEWMYSYVEERLLRHCVEWQFVDFVRQMYKDMIKERVTEYEKQVGWA